VLCCSDEIDDDLLAQIDALIDKEMLMSMGPAFKLQDKEEEDKLDSVGKHTVEVMRMVRRRLEVERATKENADMRLLAALMNQPDIEVPRHAYKCPSRLLV
jgi:hypothetical protein